MSNSLYDLTPDILQNWKDHEVLYRPGEPEDDTPICVWYQLEGTTKKVPIAAKSDMMVITGPQKSRKTLFLQCILMSRYSDDLSLTMNFKTDFGNGPIVLFDTEQPIRRTKKNMKRFHEFCEIDKPLNDYRVFNLKRFSASQKIDVITHTIAEIQAESGMDPEMVIIDQIADLCPSRDVNDTAGVDNVLNMINMWQHMTNDNTLFAVVIHTNRGRVNTNGKLGVTLDQKTDTAFHVDMDSETYISTVMHKESRDRRIAKFTFRQNYNDRPQLLTVGNNNY